MQAHQRRSLYFATDGAMMPTLREPYVNSIVSNGPDRRLLTIIFWNFAIASNSSFSWSDRD